MLMMLAVWGLFAQKVGPADAHDAGCVGGLFLRKVGPADAHDAGCAGGSFAQNRPV